MRCNERGRLALVHPEFDEAISDSALIGTAAHAAIAAVLNGEIEAADIGASASAEALKLCKEEPVHWTKWTLPGQLAGHASDAPRHGLGTSSPPSCPAARSSTSSGSPSSNSGADTVGLTGTIDYAAPDGTLWDWKTSSKKYEQRGKQRTAIQPTVYATAAMHGALDGEWPYQYPIKFYFGVMVRGEAQRPRRRSCRSMRTKAHEAWLTDHLRTYVDLADAMGVKRPWPRNEDHFLCSSTWCPWWSACVKEHDFPTRRTRGSRDGWGWPANL